jgi:anhydro-N-acetylmuramic acid kinase
MNTNLERIFKMVRQPHRLIIGLMSGTSVDGLDVALCKCSGSGAETKIGILEFETVPYNDEYRQEIKSVFSKRAVDLQQVCLLNGWIAVRHAEIVNACLRSWNIAASSVDLLASHGQTIFHSPRFLREADKFSNATLQIGDGDHLAVNTGIITISDFRQKHIAAGGEGAPLAVYGDYYIFSKKGDNRIMLNIGGIANFTCLPGEAATYKIFSTDTGPGNTLMDAYIQRYFTGSYYDHQSFIALQGNVNLPLLVRLKEHAFFSKGFPKTTGPELFNLSYIEDARQRAGVPALSHADMMATLNRFSADTIALAIQGACSGLNNVTIYASGGGMHNPLLMQNLREQLPGYQFKTTESLGINPDAKEAVLFAVLANETIAGSSLPADGSTGGIPFVSMGKISFPN